MELLLVLGVVVAADVLAMRFGYDSRDLGAVHAHRRVTDAARRGDVAGYESAMRELERDAARLRRPF